MAQKLKRTQRRKMKKPVVMSDSLNERAWINVVNSGAPSSLTAFARSRSTPQNLRELERSLSRIEAFSRHGPLRRHPVRPAILVNIPFHSWCTYLMIMQNKTSNNGNFIHFIRFIYFYYKTILRKNFL